MFVNILQITISFLNVVRMKEALSIQFLQMKENQGLSKLSKILNMLKGKSKIFLGIEVIQSVVSVKWYILNGIKYMGSL